MAVQAVAMFGTSLRLATLQIRSVVLHDRTSTTKMKTSGCEMRPRGMLTGIAEAEIRLRRAENTLRDARSNPKAMHDLSRLEDDVKEAERLLEVAHDRAAANFRIAAQKAAFDVLG